MLARSRTSAQRRNLSRKSFRAHRFTTPHASPATAPASAARRRSGMRTLWAPRIAQGREIIDAHVLEGYQGADGYMPPKGGRIDLSDEEIIAAVDYMLEQSQ